MAQTVGRRCRMSRMNVSRTLVIILICVASLGLLLLEADHFLRYGHLVPLKLHADVLVTTDEGLLGVEGTAKIYRASLTNYGILPTSIVVCDYLDSGIHRTMVNYIVERRDAQSGRWTFVPEWDSYGSRLFCRPSFEVTETHLVRRRLWPGQTLAIGEGVPAQLSGFHVGDEGRFTIFLEADDNDSNAISTAGFRVDQVPRFRKSR